jgi:hypothetical protein
VRNVPPISTRESFGHNLPLFLSTTLFTYEGITVVRKLFLNNNKILEEYEKKVKTQNF